MGFKIEKLLLGVGTVRNYLVLERFGMEKIYDGLMIMCGFNGNFI